MRMSTKMVLVFSILSASLILFNTMFSIQNDIRTFRAAQYEALKAIAERISAEIEQTITIMEYGIDEMLQSSTFMSALYTLDVLGEAGDASETYQKALNYAISAMYQQPLNDCFYSVNVVTSSGLILSNHFQKFEMAEPYSDELYEQYERQPWLKNTDFPLTGRQVIPPHPDPWNISAAKSPILYSVASLASHHGRQVAYLQVNNPIEDLEKLFSAHGMTGFSAAAIFPDRAEGPLREFYRQENDTIHYENAKPEGISVCLDDAGKSYYVAGAYCNRLRMNVYVARPSDLFVASIRQVTIRCINTGLVMLLISIILILLFSRRLTKSLRLLGSKMLHTNATAIFRKDTGDTPFPIVKVTNPRDREAKELQDTFDEMLVSLRKSTRNEMHLRESTLRAQLNALQAQINPHFVYNTLNIISAKSMQHGDFEVIDICDRFAKMLRYSTDLKTKTATLTDELENARNYLMLAKARLQDKLTYDISVPDDMLHLTLPRLSLQPIVENAVSHGYRRSLGTLHVCISCHMDENNILHLRIRDNGAGFEQDVLTNLEQSFARIEQGDHSDSLSEHIGLVNTYRRLYFFSHGNIRMRIFNDHGAVIELLVRE